MKYKLITLLGLCGSALVSFMGGWDMALQTLVIFMVIDWITGGKHTICHWQQNRWSYNEANNIWSISSKKAKHWNIWGIRL